MSSSPSDAARAARVPRKRSPRRDGSRTTLRVPVELEATARQYAEQLGTTVNDALIQLAERGAAMVNGELEVARLAAERRAAMLARRRPLDPDARFPSAEEVDEIFRAVEEE